MIAGHRSPDELARRLVEELSHNFIDGASVLARKAVNLLRRYAEESSFQDNVDLAEPMARFATELAAARPSMYAITHVLRQWQSLFATSPKQDQEAIHLAAIRVLEKIDQSTSMTVQAASAALCSFPRLLTHSASSTLQRAIETLEPARVRIIATESLPGGEGKTLARSLSAKGYGCRLLADVEAVVAVKEVDAFVVGADAILSNGDVVNKVGTRTIAEAAQAAGVPTIVVAESFKDATESVPLENVPGSTQPLFDLTPHQLVTRRIADDLSW